MSNLSLQISNITFDGKTSSHIQRQLNKIKGLSTTINTVKMQNISSTIQKELKKVPSPKIDIDTNNFYKKTRKLDSSLQKLGTSVIKISQNTSLLITKNAEAAISFSGMFSAIKKINEVYSTLSDAKKIYDETVGRGKKLFSYDFYICPLCI